MCVGGYVYVCILCMWVDQEDMAGGSLKDGTGRTLRLTLCEGLIEPIQTQFYYIKESVFLYMHVL